MAPSSSRFDRPAAAAARAAACAAAAAAVAATGLLPAAAQTTSTVTITGRNDAGPTVAGFGAAPLAKTPLQALSFGATQLADTGATSLSALTRLDASVADAYDAVGYWSIVSVRGYTLDNRANYRRDGLPINAETAIALDNKERLELLKGTSGIQAGTSAPGGLVNLVVKRPLAGQRSGRIEVRDHGSVLGAVDIGDRTGVDGALGWRINAAAERLDPLLRDTRGRRWLLAAAADWRPRSDTLFEAEVESSRQSQPSAAGFSMTGDSVPDARSIDPRLNLNRQPWRQPVVLAGTTASLRWQQRLADAWRLQAQWAAQRLHSDDRTAFPYGVYDAATYTCNQWCDRFAPDGSFTYWQYVSDDERRNTAAADVSLSGRVHTGPVGHTVQAGVLRSRFSGRFHDQVFDIAGTGRIDGSLDTPPSPGTPGANTNRSDSSTELYLRDAVQLDADDSVWLGVRQTRLRRTSVRTSADAVTGSFEPTADARSVSMPWLALARQLTPQLLAYASWGRGLESDVAPNRPVYANAGQPLPALTSRQVEVGLKLAGGWVDASAALFDVARPQTADIGSCDVAASCTRVVDGIARHRGFDGQLALRSGAFSWQFSAMLLRAEREGSRQAGIDGTRPVNVPQTSVRIGVAYQVASLPGLQVQAGLAAEGDRVVLPDDSSARIPGWSLLDAGARWTQRLDGATVTWRIALDNLANRRAWKESPYQFGHVYLYPLAPRSLRVSAEAAF